MERINPSSDTSGIVLRDVMMSDLLIFFEQEVDQEANWMAAFTVKDPTDKDAFMAHWARILANKTLFSCPDCASSRRASVVGQGLQHVVTQTILFNGEVAGHVLSYRSENDRLEVSYWLGKIYWGKGIATRALAAFLASLKERPLYARAAQDNHGSLRVLEKNGFTRIGEGKGFANARGQETAEYLLLHF